MRIKYLLFASLISMSLFGGWSLATKQNAQPEIKIQLSKAKFQPKAPVKGTIKLIFAPGMHGYQNPPSQEYQIPVKIEGLTKGMNLKVTYPKGIEKNLMGEMTAVYEGTTSFPVEFTAPTKPGTHSFDIKISYQQCNDNACDPPASVTLKVQLKVAK